MADFADFWIENEPLFREFGNLLIERIPRRAVIECTAETIRTRLEILLREIEKEDTTEQISRTEYRRGYNNAICKGCEFKDKQHERDKEKANRRDFDKCRACDKYESLRL